MDSLNAELVVLIFLGMMLFLMALAMIVLGVVVYKVAKLYAPEEIPRRGIPPFGRSRAVLEPADADYDQPVEPVKNGWPDVAAGDRVSNLASAAEMQLAGDRERWWEEKREDGYTDEQIEEMESSGVVPVFEES